MRLAGVKSGVPRRARCSPGQDHPKQQKKKKKKKDVVSTNFFLFLLVTSPPSEIGRFTPYAHALTWKYRIVKMTFFFLKKSLQVHK